MPLTSVRWWGSYLGWVDFEPPAVQPIEWHIGFWSNVPKDLMGFSYPERLLWSIDISADRVRSEYVGDDKFIEKPSDSCFRYEVKLSPEEYFRQDDYRADTIDDTFWISILAIYPESADIINPWGWKTRPLPWMDDAVTFSLLSPPYPDSVTDPNFIIPIENTQVCGYPQSYDVAFELGTDIDYIKAAQPYTGLRHWSLYSKEESNAEELPDGSIFCSWITVDDWLCQRRTPVTAAVWWGTYIYPDFGYEACTCPIVEEPKRPDYFLLTIWNHTPAGVDRSFSHPNEPIWEYKAHDYDEVMVGYDEGPVCGGCDEPNEPVFRYSVRLPEDSWFRQKDVNETYWFSVAAVFKNRPLGLHWGWTTHAPVSVNGALYCVLPFESGVRMWEEVKMRDSIITPDMSFMLFTDPGECINCADYNSDNIVNFIDYADFSEDWNWTGPPGGYNNADLNCDGSVDFYDLDIFTLQWLSSCP
jgi:hypothetical protein